MQRNANNWRKSRTHFIFISYLQLFFLWTGTTLICRMLEPLVLTSEASQVVKQRLLNFAKSLSTVLLLPMNGIDLVLRDIAKTQHHHP
ncbi:hypothetical protein KSP40_PGU008366 [Platanthera guangdongensis]|uniref:Mechanosensitive channel protein 2/3 transmembrane domain-containing protein n=1 Tax=Platanthera guangdongensis TaxID=2320717 RepID=A0ABR2MVA1_9ASPA